MTLVTAWRTTKLIEGGHRGLQAYRLICYYFYVFYVFYVFFKIQKTWLFTFFAVLQHAPRWYVTALAEELRRWLKSSHVASAESHYYNNPLTRADIIPL